MSLNRLVYVSENLLDPSRGSIVKQLGGIMAASKRNNERLGITGALVFDDLWFLQVLEGERRTIWRQFERISQDERHAAVTLVEMKTVERRVFGNWWMGLATRCAATEHLFAPFTVNGRLLAEEMDAPAILALMVALSEHGLSRALSREVADAAAPRAAA